MTLTLKNYVGFNKLPYCSAHNPSKRLQHTAVTETPESKRVAEMSKLNSGVEYKKEFEKSKGIVTSITDDPSTRLAQQQSRNVSGFSYNQVSAAARSHPPVNNNNYDENYEEPEQAPPVRLPFATGHAAPSFQPQPPPPMHASNEVYFRALYDYEAQDAEEVSFNEGDIIENFQVTGEGWGSGTVQRTGETGMIPSNYIEQC